MNENQYETLTNQKLISVEDLKDKTPRTLIYGFTLGRQTFHVYLGEDGNIYRIIHLYRHKGTQLYITSLSSGPSGGVSSNDDFVPDKRVYPESCDHEFCQILKNMGVEVPFTTFTAHAEERRKAEFGSYQGEIYDPFDSVNFDSAHRILSGVASAHQTALLQEAAASIGVDYFSNEDGAYARREHTQALCSKVKRMLLDSELAVMLNAKGGSDIAYLYLRCFGIPSGSIDVRSNGRDGGTVKSLVMMQDNPDLLTMARNRARAQNGEMSLVVDGAGKSKTCAVLLRNSGNKFDIGVVFSASPSGSATVFERLYGEEAVFISRVEAAIGYSLQEELLA